MTGESIFNLGMSSAVSEMNGTASNIEANVEVTEDDISDEDLLEDRDLDMWNNDEGMQDDTDTNFDDPLFPDSPITIGEAVLILLEFMTRHSISRVNLLIIRLN